VVTAPAACLSLEVERWAYPSVVLMLEKAGTCK